MKNRKKILFIIILLIFCAFINVDKAYAGKCTSAEITGLNNKMLVNRTENLKFNLVGCLDNFSNVDVYLSSYDGTIAIIDKASTGSASISSDKQSVKNVNAAGSVTIKANKKGTLNVKACLHGKTDNNSCNTKQITIMTSRCEYIDLQSIEKQLDYGENQWLHAEVSGCLDSNSYLDYYINGSATIVKYSTKSAQLSSDKKTLIKESAGGSIKIQAGSNDGYVTVIACLHGESPESASSVCSSAEIAIGNSKPNRQKSLTFEDTEIELKVGETETADLNFNSNNSTVLCGTGEDDEVKWSSSDSNIAIATNGSVNCEHGKIHAVSAGTATIKACLVNNPLVCASVRIIVKGDNLSNSDESKLSSFSFKKTSIAVKVLAQEKADLTFSPNIDENKVTLIPYITENGKTTYGNTTRRVATSDSGCLTVSTDKGKVYLTLNKKCEVDPTVKVCLSTDSSKCTTNNLTVTYGGLSNDHINENGETSYAVSKFSFAYDENATFTCKGLLDKNLVAVIRYVLKIVRIVVPILLILFITVDFVQVVFSGNPNGKTRDGYDDAMKKAVSRAVRRVIAAIVIFFIPMLVNVVLSMPGISESTDPNCGIEESE